MASQSSNKIKHSIATKLIDFAADTFKIALMAPGFTFSRSTHDAYADVSASELANLYGYTTGGATLAGVAVTRDDVLNALIISWSNPTWTASGGSIETCGAIIYDTTVANTIVGFIDFGENLLTIDGGVFTITNVAVAIKDIDA